MPKICYVEKSFRPLSILRIQQANEIIAEYDELGIKLNLRSLYYQFVARGFIPNNDKSYDNLGALISDARLAGLIDWNAIEDQTRSLRSNNHWDSPEMIVGACAEQFRLDRWDDQTYRPEVWIEKDAAIGSIQAVCVKLDVPFFSCRGYTSQSEMWVAGQRMRRHIKAGQKPIIFHIGDHDPSGIDMSRDIQDRLELFIGDSIEFRRIALNMDQIREYNPPPNPAKLSDSRAKDYIDRFGYESWELDALNPTKLVSLIEEGVHSILDKKKWKARDKEEQDARGELYIVSQEWDKAVRAVA
jgi:hypothetical protein